MTSPRVGSVVGLWRFPVKSMQGERIEQAELTERGIVGDRAYALIDVDRGRVVSAKSVRRFPHLLDCRAAYLEPPRAGRALPPVTITFQDGATVASDAPDVDHVLSDQLRHRVTLARAAPEDYTIDLYHPNIEDVDPSGLRDTVVAQKLGSAFFAEAGQPSPVPVGAFFDLFPVSVMTTSTLRRLGELRPGSRFDERRFRMNVIVGTADAGFVENGWIGHRVVIGETARLDVAIPDPRCVMTTLAQDGLPGDPEVMRTLIGHNRLQVGDGGRYPCAGVYAVVAAPGMLRTGDGVALV